MATVGDELFVYLIREEEDSVGVAYVETAAGVKFSLVSPDKRGAELLRPIAERLAQMTGRDVLLAHFSKRKDLLTLKAAAPA